MGCRRQSVVSQTVNNNTWQSTTFAAASGFFCAISTIFFTFNYYYAILIYFRVYRSHHHQRQLSLSLITIPLITLTIYHSAASIAPGPVIFVCRSLSITPSYHQQPGQFQHVAYARCASISFTIINLFSTTIHNRTAHALQHCIFRHHCFIFFIVSISPASPAGSSSATASVRNKLLLFIHTSTNREIFSTINSGITISNRGRRGTSTALTAGYAKPDLSIRPSRAVAQHKHYRRQSNLFPYRQSPAQLIVLSSHQQYAIAIAIAGSTITTTIYHNYRYHRSCNHYWTSTTISGVYDQQYYSLLNLPGAPFCHIAADINSTIN